MFKLDNDFLTSLGLGSLPVDEKNKLLQAIYERLEMNVGMRLAEKMTDSQLDEFEGFIDRNDEAGALRWLETNFPNYKQVVAEELDKLKSEVGASAPQILAAAQNTPAAPQAPAPSEQSQQFNQPPSFDQPQQSFEPPQPTSLPPQPEPSFQPSEPWNQPETSHQPMQPGLDQAPPSPEPTQAPAPTEEPVHGWTMSQDFPANPAGPPPPPPSEEQPTDSFPSQQPPAGFPPAS